VKKKQKERERHTKTETWKETNRLRHGKRERQADRQTQIENRHGWMKTYKQTYQTKREKESQAYRQADIQRSGRTL
jgi:hypothetical protein